MTREVTREDAIKVLKDLKPNMRFDDYGWEYFKQCIKLAISALENECKGQWITREDFIYALKTCEYTIHNGQTMYEESELIKRFDEMADMRGE